MYSHSPSILRYLVGFMSVLPNQAHVSELQKDHYITYAKVRDSKVISVGKPIHINEVRNIVTN